MVHVLPQSARDLDPVLKMLREADILTIPSEYCRHLLHHGHFSFSQTLSGTLAFVRFLDFVQLDF